MAIDRDQVQRWLEAFAASISEHREELIRLDIAIGDGDHGDNLDRGMRKAIEKLQTTEPADAGEVLKTVAMTLISTVGGAAGPLYGTLFLQLGNGLAGQSEIELEAYAAAWRRAADAVQARGKAQLGDKTMLDALLPGVEALEQAAGRGADLGTGLQAAAQAAKQGMLSTTPLVALKGRASYLGERSAGHQDPGATSTYYLFESAAQALGS